MYNQIVGFTAQRPSPGIAEVYSLGTLADKYVDFHGLPGDFITVLHTLRTKHDDEEGFVLALSQYLAVAEAMWWWYILDIPAGGVKRTRAYAMLN